MEGTLVGCAIAEKTDHYLVRASHLDGKASTASNRHAGGDDPICSQDSKVYVGDVHGTAFPVAVSGATAKKLRYHPGNITSFGYTMPMAPVCTGDVVVLAKRSARPGGCRLLADI